MKKSLLVILLILTHLICVEVGYCIANRWNLSQEEQLASNEIETTSHSSTPTVKPKETASTTEAVVEQIEDAQKTEMETISETEQIKSNSPPKSNYSEYQTSEKCYPEETSPLVDDYPVVELGPFIGAETPED